MKDVIILNLPYPVRILGVTVFIKREIGFMFTNLALYFFTQNNNLKTSSDLDKFAKNEGDGRLTTEMIHAAATAYCSFYRKKVNFEKGKLYLALTSGTEQQQKDLFTVWGDSQTFGAKYEVKKKETKRS